MLCSDSKLSITTDVAPIPPHPPARPTYLAAPWTGDSSMYGLDPWPDNGSALATAGFNHAYSGSSFYPVPAAYPSEQPEIDSGSGFPGRAPSGRSMKLKSELVGVC